MASLEKIAALMKVDITDTEKNTNDNNKKSIGQRRRAWLPQDSNISSNETPQQKEAYRPLIEKGSIKPIDKTVLSNPLINLFDQPLKNKGAIKEVDRPLSISLKDLRGNPLKIIRFLFTLINREENNITHRVTMTDALQSLGISKDSARTGFRFLLKNKLIERVNFKIGKKGWSQYQINKSLFEEITDAVLKGSMEPFQTKGFNSSGSINKITTTEIQSNKLNFMQQEDDYDIHPLTAIGFTKTHLGQILKNTDLQFEAIQDSIYAFAFDLEVNNKANVLKTAPLNYFMGILRKGMPYAPPSNYESPKERALRLFRNSKRRETEQLAIIETELLTITFEKWHAELSEEKKESLYTDDIKNSPLQARKRAFLKEYFEKNHWPQFQAQIPILLTNLKQEDQTS